MALVRATLHRERVSVNATAIQSIYLPGGDAWDFARKLGKEMVIQAIRRAPKRTGNLARQHGSVVTPIGRFAVRSTLYNDAAYATHVRRGTNDIYARMTVRPFPHSYYLVPTRRNHVRGQRPNPWMEEARDLVLARYGL